MPTTRTATPTPVAFRGYGDRRRLGFCVRLDWTDGSHEFHGWSTRLWLTEWRRASLERFWLRCPHPERPRRFRIVVMSRADFRLHRRYKCRASTCPSDPHIGRFGVEVGPG